MLSQLQHSKQHSKIFKNFIIAIQVLSLSFCSQISSADPNPKNIDDKPPVQRLTIKTAPIETPDGITHIEADNYIITTSEELTAAQKEIQKTIYTNPNTDQLSTLDVSSKGHAPTELDQKADQMLSELTNSIYAKNRIITPPLQIDPPTKKEFIKKNYNLVFSLVRFFANSGIISYNLIIHRGIPPESALFIGILAGTISAGFQYYNEAYSKLILNSMLFVKTAKKLKLLPESYNQRISTTEKILTETESYVKMGVSEVAFLGVIQLAMLMTDVPVTEDIFTTAAKSLATQGAFNAGLFKSTNELKIMNPHLAEKASILKNSFTLLGSILSVVGTVGTMSGVPFAEISFVVLIGGAVVFNLTPMLLRFKPIDNIIKAWRPIGAAMSCRMLFN